MLVSNHPQHRHHFHCIRNANIPLLMCQDDHDLLGLHTCVLQGMVTHTVHSATPSVLSRSLSLKAFRSLAGVSESGGIRVHI